LVTFDHQSLLDVVLGLEGPALALDKIFVLDLESCGLALGLEGSDLVNNTAI